jgi:hypothetical protein
MFALISGGSTLSGGPSTLSYQRISPCQDTELLGSRAVVLGYRRDAVSLLRIGLLIQSIVDCNANSFSNKTGNQVGGLLRIRLVSLRHGHPKDLEY